MYNKARHGGRVIGGRVMAGEHSSILAHGGRVMGGRVMGGERAYIEESGIYAPLVKKT